MLEVFHVEYVLEEVAHYLFFGGMFVVVYVGFLYQF